MLLGVAVEYLQRTDILSAAFKKYSEETLLIERYQKLCLYDKVIAARNNKGVAHENGTIELAHGYLKFLNLTVVKINRQVVLDSMKKEHTYPHCLIRRTNDVVEHKAHEYSTL
jgi:hypothetical protein